MNEMLQQILSLAPGIAMGATGKGGDMEAFMEGFQRANAMLDEHERRRQMDAVSMQDRKRNIERQNTLDTRATDVYNRGVEQQRQADAFQRLQIPGHLAELGGTADTPEDAQRLIETAIPGLMEAFGQETMAFGMPAVEMATRTITGRQKRLVSDYIEKALRTSYVAENPESDPEISNLPEHVARAIGKPSARLSELQSFAELPVGKPVRPPSAEVSLQRQDMMVNGRLTPVNFNPKTGAYTDQAGNPVTVDSVPPKATGGDDGLNAYQSAQLTERLAKGWNDANASGREMRRQLGLMETGLRRFREGDKNGGSQAVLVTFQKILDPTSVVRESEYARSAQGISMISRLQGYLERLEAGGAGVPDAELAGMVETARQMLADMSDYSSGQRSRIDAVAKKHGIDPILIFGMEPARSSGAGLPSDALPPMAPVGSRGTTRIPGAQGASPAAAGSGGRLPAAQLKERRKFGSELREWSGSRWVLVTPGQQ